MKFIANLNGTILCPYQILLDISEQIPDSTPRISNLAFLPICELNSTNDWINLESLGKPVAIRAKAICDKLVSELKKQHITELSLDVYCDSGQLASDNLFSLIYLAEQFHSMQVSFFTRAENQASLQSSITYLPSLDIQIKTDQLTSQNDNKLILAELENKRLQAIKSLGFSFDNEFLNNTQLPEFILNQLIGYSWICLKSGGYDIACQLLEKSHRHSGIAMSMKEQLLMHLLMIRFFSHQYALITESEFPEQFQSLGESEVKTLQFLKAYSATLSRNLTVANDYFKKCGISSDMQLTDETSLYQLNLFALSRVLQGETDTAFELEFRIKDFIEANHIDTVGLKYVNFINIARLYKKTKDYDQSFSYYNKAYDEISGGGYTSCDHIYYNMNIGSLFESAGNNEQALMYWVKAAMHWLASNNQYELSWRPRLILCSETLSDVTKPLPVNKAHTFLFDKISSLIQSCGIYISGKSSHPYQFVDDSSSIKKEHCFVKNNLLFFSGQQKALTVQNLSTAEQQLSALITDYIQTTMAIPQNQNLVIVDTHMDTKLLHNSEEAMAFAWLANCESCFFNDEWLDMNNCKPMQSVHVSLSKIIQELTQTDKGLLITYKRSFLNKTLLDQSEIDLVNRLKQADLEPVTESSLHTIKQLARKRVLIVSWAV